MPEGAREKLRLELPGIAHEWATASLGGKRLAIGFMGATATDRSVVEHYKSIEQVPAYLVDASPVLLLDGVPAAIGDSLPLGESCQLSISLRTEGLVAVDELLSGGYYSLTLDTGRTTRASMKEHVDALRAGNAVLQAAGESPEALFAPDRFLGELLGVAGSLYFALLGQNERMLANVSRVASSRAVSFAVTGVSAHTVTTFGAATSVLFDGLFIDVDRDASTAVASDGDGERVPAFMAATGAMGSALEHRIWEMAFARPVYAVSTVKAFAAAVRQRVPIHLVTAENASSQLAALSIPASVKQDIVDAVQRGYEVSVPERELHDGPWTGLGYIVRDPETGSAGYMLVSGTAGGTLEDVLMEATEGGPVMDEKTAAALSGAMRTICTFLLAVVRTLADDQIRQVAVAECLRGMGENPLDFIPIALALYSMASAWEKVAFNERLDPIEKSTLVMGISAAAAGVIGGYWAIKRAAAKSPEGAGWKYLAGWIWGVQSMVVYQGIFPWVLEGMEAS